MRRTAAAAGRWLRRPSSSAAPVSLGPQRVLGVRVVASEAGLVAEAIGVLHRRPVVQRISMATASSLAARGVPLTRPAGAPPQARPDEVPAVSAAPGKG